jgi:AraC-like DNA-binding protein
LLHEGELSFGDGTQKVEKGDMLFVPGGRQAIISYGIDEPKKVIDNEEFISNKDKYFVGNKDLNLIGKSPNSFSYITCEAKVFDSINFFASLDIPPFIIKDNPGLARLIKEVVIENAADRAGKNRVVKIKTEQVVIEIIRYILSEGMFVEKLATNSTYFKDPRLIDIFNYIRLYLGGDLSNKKLAEIANVSEDYVGQYFKMLTQINPQDYIEYQRMEMAIHLLRTTNKSIREIGQEVGYKDTAYFCRRFKMMFGIPAGKMRRRDSLMNV